ncbi:MAG: cupin domain-containing protein, partial [Chrysiogenales bacterium]
IGIIIEGRGDLHYGMESYSLEEGDTISFSSDIPHVLRNSSSVPLKAIWIITPPKMNYFGETL